MTFNPWRLLRERQVHVEWAEDRDRYGHTDFCSITLTVGMTQVERRCTLTHELVHLERGPCAPGDEAREEELVERESARLLVDIRKLGETLAWATSEEDAADELWVDLPTLRARLRGLHPSERAYLRQRLTHLG